jgi:predicted regulator of Ras-like GTPase activity (Roadblock/LC7/MglB family)
MEAAQALADLTEISSQIESAVLVGADGSVAASTFADAERGSSVAEAALELLREAEEGRPEGSAGLVQIQAATPEGCVFLVREGAHVVAAVTRPDPTVGLVFYDLKTCLRLVGEEEQKPVRKKAASKKAATGEAATAAKSEPAGEEAGGEG